jgi:hypothetical protein
MTQHTDTVALTEEINAAFSLAEDDFEIEPGETEDINKLFALCDVFD